MDKKSIRGYIGTLIIVVVFAFLMGNVYDNHYIQNRPGNTIEKWEVKPELRDGAFYYTILLPKDGLNGESVAFSTRHVEAEVTIEDELVYQLKAANPKFNKSTGYRWNFVKLSQEDEGKTMTICITPVYKGPKLDEFVYFGDEFDIYLSVIEENGVRFVLALFILVIGVTLCVYSNWIIEKKNRDAALSHFSLFSILLALWSLAESPICELIRLWPIQTLVIDHYALMVMPMSFAMFLRKLFHLNNRNWYIYTYFNILVIVIRTVLQATCILDLRETLWMTQISIMVFAALGMSWAISIFRGRKMTTKLKRNLIWISCLFGATVLELLLFIVFKKSNIVGMIGFVWYVWVMAIEMINKSRKNLERAQEAEVYRKLAFTDDLTGTYNRTAFQRDMDDQWTVNEKTGKKIVKQNTIFMFDLNDLKKCNDTYGHEYGDQYIKMISEVLLRIIGVDGRCYRIGGDEFCAILPDISQNEADNKLIGITKDIQELDRKGFVVPVSLAIGYAMYNPQYDESLEDTMKRADMLMYQNKQQMKKKRQMANE
ncbi:MAG: diguanylate cyclase [Eubacteriales bacterium]|nr:diguanylate cyclase [Eubacteriales bacterium]